MTCPASNFTDDASSSMTRLSMRALDHRSRKCLRCLRAPKTEAIDRHYHVATRVDPLECIRNWNRRHGSLSLAGLVKDTADGLLGDERPRGIVDNHDLALRRQVFEAVGHGFTAVLTADR